MKRTVDSEKLFQRTRRILDPRRVSGERPLVIGQGSGGARAAEEMVRLGVPRIDLIDLPDELLEEHNIIRHSLGYRYLNQVKLEAVADHLRDINPQCEVVTHGLDVCEDSEVLASLVEEASRIFLCTDNEPSKHSVNLLAVQAGVPLIFAGVFDGGVGGEVGLVEPGGACYACFASHLNRTVSMQEEEPTFDYSRPESMNQPTAALNIDIATVALAQARIGLLSMLQDEREAQFEGNYLLIGNRPVEGLFDDFYHREIWTVPKNPKCKICGPNDLAASDVEEIDAILDRARQS